MVFKRLFKGLAKTREKLSSGLKSVFSLDRTLDDDFIDELEEVLYLSDMGTTAVRAIDRIKEAYKSREIKSTEDVREFLKAHLKGVMQGEEVRLPEAPSGPTVILVVGVNGSGKTTSIAKLGHLYSAAGKKVVFGACDTFRAAAVQQLTLWSERIGATIVKKEAGNDPAAVAFDAVDCALKDEADVVIVDTAGRLHTQQNLMQELEKIKRVITRKIPDAPHEVLLVLDATTGQNAVVQARQFSEAVEVTGLFLAKLDGTAKGGAVVSIREQVNIPVKFVGVGESYEDVEFFDANAFVDSILE
jgi:fused signal recognition particle receptor